MRPRSALHPSIRFRLLQLCLPVAAAVCTTTARADQVRGTRSDELEERSHDATLTIAAGHAELVVRRRVFNGGPRHDQAVFDIDVPPRSVAVGLRTLGSLRGLPHWFSGDLLEAEEAAAKYRELTGIGGYYPKDPALLSWRSQERLALQVFPCPPQAHKSIEYTFVLPTDYREGRHHVQLPAMGTDHLLADVHVRPAKGAGRLWLEGKPLSFGARLWRSATGYGDVALEPRRPRRLGGALAVVALQNQRALNRYRVEAAPALSVVPQGARIVVLLDGSRSMGPTQSRASVAAARAYLSHFDSAQVEVVTFDRQMHRRYGRFVSVAVARADLATYAIKRRNGSHADKALAFANELLERAPDSAAKRIVLFTDTRTRSSLSVERLAAAAQSDRAIVHATRVSAGSPSLRRDDAHPWSKAMRPSGGVFWQGSASTDADERSSMAQIYEELARPLRIDHLKVTESDGADDGPAFGSTLNEGEGLERLEIGDRALRWVKVEGELWSRPVREVLLPDEAESKLWSALVFGSSVLSELSEPEMMILARKGGAVSPVTSYLAIEPGVRPSTEGLDWGTGEGFGSGFGRLGGSHRVGPVRVRMGASFDPEAFLREQLAAAWQICGGTPGAARVSLETTLDEVVDVTAVELDPGGDAIQQRCLEHAVWSLDLPAGFVAPWESYSLRV